MNFIQVSPFYILLEFHYEFTTLIVFSVMSKSLDGIKFSYIFEL
jgi:hypothetical protein